MEKCHTMVSGAWLCLVCCVEESILRDLTMQRAHNKCKDYDTIVLYISGCFQMLFSNFLFQFHLLVYRCMTYIAFFFLSDIYSCLAM